MRGVHGHNGAKAFVRRLLLVVSRVLESWSPVPSKSSSRSLPSYAISDEAIKTLRTLVSIPSWGPSVRASLEFHVQRISAVIGNYGPVMAFHASRLAFAQAKELPKASSSPLLKASLRSISATKLDLLERKGSILFKEADLNKNGTLTKEELMGAVRSDQQMALLLQSTSAHDIRTPLGLAALFEDLESLHTMRGLFLFRMQS